MNILQNVLKANLDFAGITNHKISFSNSKQKARLGGWPHMWQVWCLMCDKSSLQSCVWFWDTLSLDADWSLAILPSEDEGCCYRRVGLPEPAYKTATTSFSISVWPWAEQSPKREGPTYWNLIESIKLLRVFLGNELFFPNALLLFTANFVIKHWYMSHI